jgi:hypothetical protein
MVAQSGPPSWTPSPPRTREPRRWAPLGLSSAPRPPPWTTTSPSSTARSWHPGLVFKVVRGRALGDCSAPRDRTCCHRHREASCGTARPWRRFAMPLRRPSTQCARGFRGPSGAPRRYPRTGTRPCQRQRLAYRQKPAPSEAVRSVRMHGRARRTGAGVVVLCDRRHHLKASIRAAMAPRAT